MGGSASKLVIQRFPFQDLLNTQYLFNKTQYLKEYETDYLLRWCWESEAGKFYSLTGVIQDDQFFSIPWATFGGFELDLSSNSEDINEFIIKIISTAKQEAVRKIKITLPPEVYLSRNPQVREVLMNNGFETIQSDINQHILVSNTSYRQLIAYNELKKLKKSEQKGFSFRQLNRSHLSQAYRLISENRIRKGFPVSMTFQTLDNMFMKLPDFYHLFGVYNEDKLIATAVSIRISQSSIYNFYHGDEEEYRVFSPVVMLLDGIYGYCQRQGIKILDLGISSEEGKLNSGLYKFKKNCGAQTSSKDVVSKSIDLL